MDIPSSPFSLSSSSDSLASLTLSPLNFSSEPSSPLGKRKHRRQRKISESAPVTADELERVWKEMREAGGGNAPPVDELEEPRVKALIAAWQSRRSRMFDMHQRTKDHKCFLGVCQIDTLDRSIHLYGCRTGGNVHICHVDERCHSTCTNTEGIRMCAVSRREISPLIVSSLYGKPEKGVDDEMEESGYDMEDEDAEEEEIIETAGKIVDAIDDVPLGELDEAVVPEEMDESGFEIKQPEAIQKADKLMAMMNKKGAGGKGRQKKKLKQRRCFQGNFDVLEREASGIIEDLLYNREIRERLNRPRNEENEETAVTELAKYYRRCQRKDTSPMMLKTSRIICKSINKKRLFVILEYDHDRMKHYIQICVHLWYALMLTPYCSPKTKPTFHFNQHVLGTLYTIADGLAYDGYVIFPGDEYLKRHLPHKTDLASFPPSHYASGTHSYNKKDVTMGVNNIKFCFNQLNIQEHPEVLRELEQVRKWAGL